VASKVFRGWMDKPIQPRRLFMLRPIGGLKQSIRLRGIACQGGADLYVRKRNTDEPKVIPAEQWEFVDAQTVRLLPAGTSFRIGAIYQFVYKAGNPRSLASRQRAISCRSFATPRAMITARPIRRLPPDGQC